MKSLRFYIAGLRLLPRRRILDAARVSLLFLAAFALLAPGAAAQRESASISGKVLTDNGRVIPSGVLLRLETSEGELIQQQPVNSDGEFNFDNLHKMRYHLTANADGFQPSEKDVDLGVSANRAIVTLQMTPETKTRFSSASLPAITDMQAPAKARKEYEKGFRAMAERNLGEAQARFEAAVAAYPCYARAQTDLATALTLQHETTRAEAALKKSVECDPGYLDAYPELAQLYNSEKKFAESETVLQQGLRHTADAWSIYYQLGVAFYGEGQYAKAEEAFLKAQSLNSEPPAEVHVKLADVYLKQRNYEKAYAEMQAYLRADANGKMAAKIKNIMQQMESSGVLTATKTPESSPPKP